MSSSTIVTIEVCFTGGLTLLLVLENVVHPDKNKNIKINITFI
jgi:hypothetical protein